MALLNQLSRITQIYFINRKVQKSWGEEGRQGSSYLIRAKNLSLKLAVQTIKTAGTRQAWFRDKQFDLSH